MVLSYIWLMHVRRIPGSIAHLFGNNVFDADESRIGFIGVVNDALVEVRREMFAEVMRLNVA